MLINPVSTSFKAKIPRRYVTEMPVNIVSLKDYKGPVLKLTKKEQARISALDADIAYHNQELINLQNVLKSNNGYYSKYYYFDKIMYHESQIEIAEKEKRDIKVNRFSIQKAKYEAKNAGISAS